LRPTIALLRGTRMPVMLATSLLVGTSRWVTMPVWQP
jgi:hypothetical protein